MMTLGRYCLVATGGLVVGICYLALAIGHRPAGIPPGPPTIPIFGNLLQVRISSNFTPRVCAWIQYQHLICYRCLSMMLIYSFRNGPKNTGMSIGRIFQFVNILSRPIYSLILGTRILIVLSSDIAIKDLLDKRSGIYSDRQDLYISSGIVSGGLRVLLMVSFHFPIPT